MVTAKKGKKDFMSGLDMIIQKTTAAVTEQEPENDNDIQELQEKKDVKEDKEVKENKEGVEKERPMTIKIPASLKRNIKKYCAANEISIKDLFIRSVSAYMEKGL